MDFGGCMGALRAATLTVALVLAGATASAGHSTGNYQGPDDRVFSWSGFYVGATAGGAWGETRYDDGGTLSNPFDIDGFVAGATVGYNFQFARNWVLGIEADISYSNVGGSFGPGNLRTPNGERWDCIPGACVTDVNWFGTVRGRIGYAAHTVLIYGTGGLAFGEVEAEIAPIVHVSNVNAGWTVGGGIEFGFAPGWSAKVEYLHVDLGWTDRQLGIRADAEFDLVRAGLNFRFGNHQHAPLK